MTLRTYEGKPAVGFAWTSDGNGETSSIARFNDSLLDVIRNDSPDFRISAKQIRELSKELNREIRQNSGMVYQELLNRVTLSGRFV